MLFMKTLIRCVSLATCLFMSSLYGQISVGMEAGYTRSWEDYGDVVLPPDAKIHVEGFNVSLLAYLKLTDHFSLGIEPGYIQRGAACVPGWIPVFEGDSKLFLDQIEVPLMASFNVPLFNDKLDVFARLGYGASMLLSATEEVLRNGEEDPVKTRLDINDTRRDLNRFDHGAYGSFGVGYNVGKGQLFVKTDYYMAISHAVGFTASQNRNINVNMGYMIDL